MVAKNRLSEKKRGPEMICFEDRGTVLNAPIDVVWDFMLKDREYHPRAHRNTLRNMKWKRQNDITGEGTCEVIRAGRWSKMKFRMTTIPPYVRISEEFGGRYAGQKMVFLYTPNGRNKTTIDVFVYTQKRLAQEVKRELVEAHKEDLPMLREFARKQLKENRKS
jgi:hypothetical protein